MSMREEIFKYKDFADGLTVGNLVTSIAFYMAFDQWKPMVWSAAIVSVIQVLNHLFKAID